MKIIVGVDGGEQQPDALALADRLATLGEDVELLVVHVYPWSRASVRFGGAYAETVEEDSRGIVAAARQTLTSASTGRVLGAASPARGLIGLCEQEAADLLVLGACHRGPLGRTVLGGVGDHVVHGAPCAVAVAPRGYADDQGPVRSVAVGYDGTPESRAALDWAQTAATRAGAGLTLYTILEAVGMAIYPQAALAYGALHDEQRERLRATLDEAVAAAPAELHARGELIEGVGAEALADATGRHDLLVLGSRGYGPVGNVLLGGVSRSVMHHAACPVVILRRSSTVAQPALQAAATAPVTG